VVFMKHCWDCRHGVYTNEIPVFAYWNLHFWC
jgi:hypothetical protein